VVRTVHVEDGVRAPLEMLPVLAADRMGELLARELIALGFTRDGNTARRVDPDGIEVEVDLAAASVTVRLGAGAQLDEEVELTGQVVEERRESAEARLHDAAIRKLDDRIAAKTEALRREVTAKLERKLADLRSELDGAIGRATVAALTERAGQLGQIQEVVADDAGNVTIKVKL
jgi:hypothetical protein